MGQALNKFLSRKQKQNVQGSISLKNVSQFESIIDVCLEESRKIKANDPTSNAARGYAVSDGMAAEANEKRIRFQSMF